MLNVTKENSKTKLFLKISVFDEFGGPFKVALLGSKGPKGLKAVDLVIEA